MESRVQLLHTAKTIFLAMKNSITQVVENSTGKITHIKGQINITLVMENSIPLNHFF